MTDSLARLTSALADRYRIERELGEGGMATVYLAEDVKHDRKVAVSWPRSRRRRTCSIRTSFRCTTRVKRAAPCST
jgi:hypothetical protein